jgi:hypothetical protein
VGRPPQVAWRSHQVRPYSASLPPCFSDPTECSCHGACASSFQMANSLSSNSEIRRPALRKLALCLTASKRPCGVRWGEPAHQDSTQVEAATLTRSGSCCMSLRLWKQLHNLAARHHLRPKPCLFTTKLFDSCIVYPCQPPRQCSLTSWPPTGVAARCPFDGCSVTNGA